MKKAKPLLDHFVSQVHLKRFNAPSLDNKKLYGTKKSDLSKFICSSKNVCRIRGNSDNDFIIEERAVELFLKYIEPYYNRSVEKIAIGKPDHDAIFVISGFVTYIMCCSPSGVRQQTRPIQSSIEATARMLDTMGKIPSPPSILGAATLSELIDNGTVKVDIDPKYPQAVGITNILNISTAFANSRWDIIINRFPDFPFLTSDYPVALEIPSDPHVLNRIIPLTPSLAVRIQPVITDKDVDISVLPDFRFRMMEPNLLEIAYINRLIVQSAETQVYASLDAIWIDDLIRENASCRIEPVVTEIPVAEGYMLFSTMRIKTSSN